MQQSALPHRVLPRRLVPASLQQEASLRVCSLHRLLQPLHLRVRSLLQTCMRVSALQLFRQPLRIELISSRQLHFAALMRRKAALPLDNLKMLYFINPESDRNLDLRPLQEIAASTIFKVHPDGLCISANAAGQDVDEELITAVKSRNPEVAVLCNTGCRPDTIIRKLRVADAAVVGTYFKQGGKLENERLENVRVDAARVRMFMDVVREFRTTL